CPCSTTASTRRCARTASRWSHGTAIGSGYGGRRSFGTSITTTAASRRRRWRSRASSCSRTSASGCEREHREPFGHQSTRGVSMYRSILVACLAASGALLLHLIVNAAAPPQPGRKPNPNKGSELYVILKARVYEVDQSFHNKVAKARWLSRA